MALQWSAPELATRYSVHVEELRDFFALQQLHFGCAQDIAPLVMRIDSSESFREDLTSMVRSIILHEGGTIPRANLLEIVAIAIGGRDMDEASLEVQEPLRHLLGFLISVMHKPWNQPPAERRLQLAPLPSADRGVAEAGAEPTQPSDEAAPAAVGKVIPITARPAHSFARAEGTFSRLAHFDSEAAAVARPLPEPEFPQRWEASPEIAAPLIAGAPTPTPEPIPPPPPPPLADQPVSTAGARPTMHLPMALRAQTRIALLSAGGAVLCIAVLVFASGSRSPAAVGVGQQPLAATAPTNSGADTAIRPAASISDLPAASAGPPAKPSADGPAIAQRLSHMSKGPGSRDDDYIAKPYSTPIPREAGATPAAAPIVRTSPAQPAPTGLGRRVDATYVGAASADDVIPIPRRPASVASSVMAANLLSAPAPGYPVLARVAHIQGPVVLRADVDRDGTIIDVRVVSGHHLLRGAAVDAVRHWRYRPYLIDGRPAPVSTTVILRFPETAGRRNR